MRLIRFGAAGWRARYDDGFDDEGVARVADALGQLWADQQPGATVLVGYDARFRATHFAELAAAVIASYGLRVKVSDGPCPTPVLGWSAAQDETCAGALMLTASGSSCEYGGMLVRGADGGTVPEPFREALDRTIPVRATSNRGSFDRVDLVTGYLDHIEQDLDVDALRAAHLRVVVDAMHGAALTMVGPLMNRLGCEATLLHTEPSVDFGGLHPVPDEPWADACERAVVHEGACCGIICDGDADRATLVDERGRLVSKHDLVTLLIRHLVCGRGERGRVVVTTATSMRTQRQAEALGCPVTVVPVGFGRVYDEILEGDVLVATEEYGGICVPRHLKERDGIYACVLGLEMIARLGRPLSVLVDAQKEALGDLSYIERTVRLDGAALQRLAILLPGMNPSSFAGMAPVAVNHADGMGLTFADGSWVQVRVARTEPVARIYAEAPTHLTCANLVNAALSLARSPSPAAGTCGGDVETRILAPRGRGGE